MKLCRTLLPLAFFCAAGSAASIADINGNKFVTSYNSKLVRDVAGIITARTKTGFWMRSTSPDTDARTSESLYVYDNSTATSSLKVGDNVTLSGKISSYRSSTEYIPLTELTNPTSIKVISSSNKVNPIILGSSNVTTPPYLQYTSLDKGNVLTLPANTSRISTTNPTLFPAEYGLDFYQALISELVTIPAPVSVSKADKYGSTYVISSTWSKGASTNSRGGLTFLNVTANPQALVIGEPLDGTKNPTTTKLGDSLSDITGIITQQYGAYTLLPLTAPSIKSSASPTLPDPVAYKSSGKCDAVTLADYNIENFSVNSSNLAGRAEHIVKYLNSPSLIFLQEVQDSDGPTNDGVVDANITLTTLVSAISQAGGPKYVYVDINPVNDQDGGQPGGNIRQAYLYDPSILHLTPDIPIGDSTTAVSVTSGPNPHLTLNPGRIEPSSVAWRDSRKPLAAQWTINSDNTTFFTVNVHLTAKLGSSALQGDARPPVNGGVEQRILQANVTATFISSILSADPDARVIMGGDCNDFSFAQPLQTFMQISQLKDVDDVAQIPLEERYTYVFGPNAQEIDHFFVSSRIASRGLQVEHVHVNTWVDLADEVSDHDPSVMQINVCA